VVATVLVDSTVTVVVTAALTVTVLVATVKIVGIVVNQCRIFT
jgi:hypothetical protein